MHDEHYYFQKLQSSSRAKGSQVGYTSCRVSWLRRAGYNVSKTSLLVHWRWHGHDRTRSNRADCGCRECHWLSQSLLRQTTPNRRKNARDTQTFADTSTTRNPDAQSPSRPTSRLSLSPRISPVLFGLSRLASSAAESANGTHKQLGSEKIGSRGTVERGAFESSTTFFSASIHERGYLRLRRRSDEN